ncbi:NrfD/PsrC family molybdoenzyme membrane anchor subunit [Geodermatophilus sp. SYSU D00815]
MAAQVTGPGQGWRSAMGPALQRRRRKGGGRGRGEVAMVPEAEFTSYYGRPIIKEPAWKSPEVPLYLFFGGAAGATSVLGALGEFTDRPKLTRAAHLFAGGGALASVGLLVVDLGRPERFLHMLRVFKPTSPLSVGTYILSPFSALAVATAGLHVLGRFPVLRKLGAVGSAVFAGPLATYTGVLLGNTAVPSWHAAGTQLPYVFGASGMAAGGGITMALAPVAEAAPARRMAVAGAAIELAVMQKVETGHGIVSEPFHEGRPGRLLRAAKACTAAGAALTVVAGRRRLGAVAAGALLAAGSALTRFGVYDAGVASARDPKYTVVPQRERLAARQNGHAPTVTT